MSSLTLMVFFDPIKQSLYSQTFDPSKWSNWFFPISEVQYPPVDESKKQAHPDTRSSNPDSSTNDEISSLLIFLCFNFQIGSLKNPLFFRQLNRYKLFEA